MRTRAYRPEAPCCLEGRSLLSGVAGASANPVRFPIAQFDFALNNAWGSFLGYSHDSDPVHLRNELRDDVYQIPFGRVDNLGVTITDIVNNMLQEIGGGARFPNSRPVYQAGRQALAAIRAQVEYRVRLGDVVITR